jgi:hypothetical protein
VLLGRLAHDADGGLVEILALGLAGRLGHASGTV